MESVIYFCKREILVLEILEIFSLKNMSLV